MENFDINRFLKIVCNCKFYIAFILIFCLGIGYFYSYYYITPMYQSSATVVLVQNENLEQEVTDDSGITQTDITLNKNLLSTYTKIAKSYKVLEKVIEDLDLNMTPSTLSSLVSVQAINNTQVFKISVSNQDKELAPKITNHLLEVFSEEVRSLYHMNNIYTMDFAEASNTPYNINHTKDLAIFAMIGLVLSFCLVIVFYLFDTTIKSEKDVEDYADLSVLSTIPMYTNKSGKKNSELIVNEQPKSPISECFKTFRTNVMFSIQNKKLNTILVTSGFMGEGKSFVSSNLAVAFANSGKKVILVDTDMRKGRVHKIFDLPNEQGLSTCLAKIGTHGNLVNINEFIKESHITNLHVMTSGIVPPNPSELLSSSNMIRLLEALNRQYDIVICDGTPCMLVSDSIILSKIVDTTVIVTANKTTKLDTLLKMKKSIEMVGGNISGVVINKMEVNAKSYQNSYYYGEHDTTKTESIPFIHDIILDTPLFVKELGEIIQNDQTVSNSSFEEEEVTPSSNKELTILSNTIYENTKQISELKGLYKDVMQNTLKLIDKNDPSQSVLEKLADIKNDYREATIKQTNQIEDMSMKYEKQINDINDKISNFEFPDYSDSIIDELNNIKSDYQNTITAQAQQLQDISIKYEKQINDINDKISNFEFPDYSDTITDEFAKLQNQYQQSSDFQQEQILSIHKKLENIQNSERLNPIVDKLDDLQNKYNRSIEVQNEEIELLNQKFEDFKMNSSDVILEKLNSFNDSDKILDKMDSMENNYKSLLQMQEEKIDALNKKIDHFKVEKEPTELQNQVIQIYHQLEFMNAKFESLEQRASQNEILIQNLSNEVKNSLYQPKSYLDIDKLNHKVIQIQDYLEKTTQTSSEMKPSKTSKKSKGILEGQMNIIDDLLKNTIDVAKVDNTQNRQNFVVDYESVKRRQTRKGFSLFRTKPDNTLVEEEPITIVSQILSSHNESVG